jgi:hypothetical protein
MRMGKVPGRIAKLAEIMSRDFLVRIRGADVIWGRDEETGNEFIVFGQSRSKVLVKSGSASDGNVMWVDLVERSAELDALRNAVIAIKGYDEYKPMTNSPTGDRP